MCSVTPEQLPRKQMPERRDYPLIYCIITLYAQLLWLQLKMLIKMQVFIYVLYVCYMSQRTEFVSCSPDCHSHAERATWITRQTKNKGAFKLAFQVMCKSFKQHEYDLWTYSTLVVFLKSTRCGSNFPTSVIWELLFAINNIQGVPKNPKPLKYQPKFTKLS